MSKYKIAVGIAIVAAAGVVTGLLVAPQKGSKLRKRLKKNCRKVFSETLGKFTGETGNKEDVEEKSPSVGF